MVDCKWGRVTELVKNFCRRSPHAAILLPAQGKGIGASNKPFSEYTRHAGELLGDHWWIPAPMRGGVRYITIDTNFWKSFVHSRLHLAVGDRGGLTLFGHQPGLHTGFADQLTAEYAVRTQGYGRTVDEWKVKPGRPDNHFFDCLTGCCVGASMLGCKLAGLVQEAPPKPKKKRERVTLLEF